MPILFIDIETVPAYKHYHEAPLDYQIHWNHKSKLLNSEVKAEDQYQRAGIYAEFGKVIVVSVGLYSTANQETSLKVKSYAQKNEGDLLTELAAMLRKLSPAETFICGHNIKEFDIPFLCRRMIINKIPIPDIINVSGKKPWETSFIDTLELWKFGDYKHYSKLSLLAYVLELPTSKDDIDGSEVYSVYYEEGNLKRIREYCEKDVILSCRVYQRLKGIAPIQDEQIKKVD